MMIDNKIASRGKRDKVKMLKEMVESKDQKTSRLQGFKNRVFKAQPTLNQFLKTKREKRKKLNKAKFTKIRIKKLKID